MVRFSGTFQGQTHGGSSGGGGGGGAIVVLIIVALALLAPTAGIVGTAIGGWLLVVGQIIGWSLGAGAAVGATYLVVTRGRDRRKVRAFKAHAAQIAEMRERGQIPAAPPWRSINRTTPRVRQPVRAEATRLDRD